MKFKKILTIGLILTIGVCMLVGCKKEDGKNIEKENTTIENESSESENEGLLIEGDDISIDDSLEASDNFGEWGDEDFGSNFGDESEGTFEDEK